MLTSPALHLCTWLLCISILRPALQVPAVESPAISCLSCISCRYCGTGEAFDNIYVERDIATWEDLDERLRRMEHFIQNPPGPPLRLVVIDSVAHLFSDSADFQTGMSVPVKSYRCPAVRLPSGPYQHHSRILCARADVLNVCAVAESSPGNAGLFPAK